MFKYVHYILWKKQSVSTMLESQFLLVTISIQTGDNKFLANNFDSNLVPMIMLINQN